MTRWGRAGRAGRADRADRDGRHPADFTAAQFVSGVAVASGVFLVGTVLTSAALILPSIVLDPSALLDGSAQAGSGQLIAFGLAFVVITAIVVLIPGWPIALAIATALTRVRSPAVHLAAHGAGAALVAAAVVSVPAFAAGTARPLELVPSVLAWGWPVIVGAVVSTEVAWVVTASRVRRRGQDPSTSTRELSPASSGSGRA